MLFDLLPSKVLRISPACVDSVCCVFTEHSDCVKIQVALSLHIAEKFVWATQFRARQVLQRVGLLPWGYRHQQASVGVLLRVGFFLFESTATEDQHPNFSMLLLGLHSRLVVESVFLNRLEVQLGLLEGVIFCWQGYHAKVGSPHHSQRICFSLLF